MGEVARVFLLCFPGIRRSDRQFWLGNMGNSYVREKLHIESFLAVQVNRATVP
jgi:hypothetical protein